jgi:hypothetical protein
MLLSADPRSGNEKIVASLSNVEAKTASELRSAVPPLRMLTSCEQEVVGG